MPVAETLRITGRFVVRFAASARVAFTLASCIVGLVAASECHAQVQSKPLQPPSGGNLIVLEVRLDNFLVSDGVTAYQLGNRVLLPLGELSRLLTIAIRTDPEQGTASGFILSEARTFFLDTAKAAVRFAERSETYDPKLVLVYPDEIYVATELLARWLPLGLDVNFSSLTLTVRPREILPLQRRLQRERDAGQGRAGFITDPGYPRQASPYSLWGIPFIDHTLSMELARRDDKWKIGGRQSTFVTGDLLGLESSVFVTGTERNPLEKFRATFGRYDPSAQLLGPAHATAFAFGNLPVPALANVSRTSAGGNGLLLSNAPLTRPTSFRSQSFQGDLPPGWDVELYFNEALIAYQQSRPDGKYVFEDVQLVYGVNEFRLVFHGPQGQIRVERQSFQLQDTLTRPGEAHYHLVGQHGDQGGLRSSAQFDVGLSNYLSAAGGAVRIPVNGVERTYTNVGLRSQFAGFFVTGDLTRSEGGTLGEVAALTRIAGVGLSLSHAELRNFTSEVFQFTADPVRSRSKVRADGFFRAHPTIPMSYGFELLHDRLQSGISNTDVRGRLSTFVRGTSISNNLHWQRAGASEATGDGALNVSTRFGPLGVRGQFNYTVAPVREVSSVALAGTRILKEGYIFNSGVTRILTSGEMRYSAGLTKSIGRYGFGVGLAYSSLGEIVVGGQIFIAIAKEPRGGAWVFDALPMAATGAVSARVFVDKNMNGIMDPGEEPVKDAAFMVNGGRYPARTGEDGIAYIRRLSPKAPLDINLDPGTLEDPQWSPSPLGLRIVPRPGKSVILDFPVILTGEIDGTVYSVDSRKVKQPVGDLSIEALNDKGKVVSRAPSASDGFYVLTAVPPGVYRIRVDAGEARKRRLNEPASRTVTITADGNFVSGVDFTVTRETGATQTKEETK